MKTLRLYRLFVPLLLLSAFSAKAGPGDAGSIVPGQESDPVKLPRAIYSGERGPFHVQGAVVDLQRGCVYFSFTTSLLKTDLQGRPIGSVTGLTGHLGCLTYDPAEGRVYGSLEYKNDKIGKGIRDKLGEAEREDSAPEDAFYIAIFDGDKITRPEMDAEKEGIMTAVCLDEVANDYYAETINGGIKRTHRYGCSGIDGISFGPAFGEPKTDKNYLYVAYGIYSDTTRTDNDYQVILAYDTGDWQRYERPLTQEALHRSGPREPLHKYFVRTGNTSYGIQNLAYDPDSGNWFAAVYRGRKKEYPNYDLFIIDGRQFPQKVLLSGFDKPEEAEVLSLLPAGLRHEPSDTWGWNFKWGATGLCPVGRGYFYISHNAASPDRRQQSSTLRLYRWTNDPQQPFEQVE